MDRLKLSIAFGIYQTPQYFVCQLSTYITYFKYVFYRILQSSGDSTLGQMEILVLLERLGCMATLLPIKFKVETFLFPLLVTLDDINWSFVTVLFLGMNCRTPT